MFGLKKKDKQHRTGFPVRKYEDRIPCPSCNHKLGRDITKEEYEYYFIQGNPFPFEVKIKNQLPKSMAPVPMPKCETPLEEGYNYFVFNYLNSNIEVKLGVQILKGDIDYIVLDKGIKIINNNILELLKNNKKLKIDIKWRMAM